MATLFKHFYSEGVTALCQSQVGCWRYNLRNLAFLQEQMDKLNSCQGISEMLETAKAAEAGSARRACYARLAHAMSLWDMLICHHTKSFQLDNFYTAVEVQTVVQKICSSFIAFAEEFNLGGLRIEDSMPPKDVDVDSRALEERLGYILGLQKPCPNGISKDVIQECEQAKTVHSQQLSHWFISGEEIVVGKCISGAVFSCTQRGREYAVKNVLRSDDGHKDLVGLARLYTATKGTINSPAVVRLFGITCSGKLVMEMGEADMLTWFLRHQSEGLQLKLQLLQKAALALADVHHEGIVHCNVRLQKFIVFKGNQLEVKISVFNYSTNRSADANIVLGEAGAVENVAPEMLYVAPHSFLCDIYNFGVVANMLVSEVQPCRRDTPDLEVLQRKARRQTPWKLPNDCPEELVKLISECCSLDPAARPSSMEDVRKRLATLSQSYAASRGTLIQKAATPEESLFELASAKYNKKNDGFLEPAAGKSSQFKRTQMGKHRVSDGI